MRGSFKLFTWLGIPVYLHWTFGLIFVYILWHAQSEGLGTLETVWLTGLFMALFLCVLLHEYGHAIAARKYGVKTRDIVLMPIGGVARLEKMPEKPVQEFVVAIAGPAVNVMIATLLFLGMNFGVEGDLWELFSYAIRSDIGSEIVTESGYFLSPELHFIIKLAFTNVALVIFNMIPAFPMDGGRVFRALLSMWLGRPRATNIAAWVGQLIALLLVGAGIWGSDVMLSVLGIFVIYAARAENSNVQTEDLLSKFKVKDVIRPQYTRMRSNDWMLSAIETLKHGLERHFLVFDMADNLIGMLEEEDILRAMRKPDVTAEIMQYAQRVEIVSLEDSLLKIHYLIRQRGFGILGVADESGQLIGVVDEAGLAHFIRLEEGR
ncbi:MAG TPA: site-2 protease family protein [Saprospiraceae bacterium]|nr:site-2 protease family protein [Saprospiraceae bacterium]